MAQAGPVSWARLVCRDLSTFVKDAKNQLHDYRETSQPGRALQNVGMEWNEVE